VSDMVKMAEIARRLGLDLSSFRRFIAKDGASLHIER
jgi:predicted DsbA family dithiol-disulfide isomerase